MALRGPGEKPSLPSDIAPGNRLPLRIDSLAFGGEGVARRDGLVILVEGGLPGEIVDARIERRTRNFARARAERVLSVSSSRVAPACVHFSECGGCAYQSLEYAAQLVAKQRQVTDLLERIGGFDGPPVATIRPGPAAYAYRRRMTYALPLANGGPGLHRRGSPERILEVEGCLLPEEGLQRTYRRLLADFRSLRMAARPVQIELHAGDQERPVAVLRGRREPGPEIARLAAEWTAREGPLGGVVWYRSADPIRRDREGKTTLLAGEGDIRTRMGPFTYRIPAGCFFQANVLQAEQLFRESAGRCAAVAGDILELYAGVGALSLFLAATGRPLLAVEGDAAAVAAARENGGANGMGRIAFQAQPVVQAARGLAASARRFGSVVVDPPRTGLPPGVARSLGGLALEQILYLSCNPSTLARDLKEMTSGGEFRLREVVPWDLFPQTAEIECLAELRREGGDQLARSRISPSRSAS
jgi:23S rRNA (uracil1939-C5)-methyltransferase